MAKKKYSEDELVTRNYQASYKAIENREVGNEEKTGKMISGTPIVFEQETVIEDWDGTYREVIDKRALDNANLNDVCLLVNHDTNKIPLARSNVKNGKSTMKFYVDDDGFHFDAELDTDRNTESKNLYSAIDRGDVSTMSFMFRIAKDEWSPAIEEGGLPLRRIKEISIVHEVSATTWGAYPQTSLVARNKKPKEIGLKPVEETTEVSEETDKRANQLALEKLKFEILHRKEK